MRIAENAGPKKVAKNHHLGTIPQLLSDNIFAIKACIDNRKKLLSSNITSTYPHNMVNFGPLAAEILSLVWSTPANFNGFCVLAALMHRRGSTEVNQTLQDVWPSPGLYTIYTLAGALAP